MKRNVFLFAAILSAGFAQPLVAENQPGTKNQPGNQQWREEERGRMGDLTLDEGSRQDLNKLVNNASTVYGAIKNIVPTNVKNNAKCIAIFPDSTTMAAGIGLRHGEGVVSCKGDKGNWSPVAFLNLNRGSVGAQAGIKTTDTVLFFTNDDALQLLSRQTFSVGGDVDAVLGATGEPQREQTAFKGAVAYQRSGGAFIGASITGASLTTDEQAERTYYGDQVNHGALINGTSPAKPSNEVKALLDQLPKGAA